MDTGIYQATHGCRVQARRFDIITNNLANVSTHGFKKDILTFDRAFKDATRTDLGQGTLRTTGNPLDIAIEGDGFFEIKTQGGTRYTRNGAFCLNAGGELVTQSGDQVLGENGPILIAGTDISIDTRGQVRVDGAVVGTLSVVTFTLPEELQKEGQAYCLYKGGKGTITKPENVQVKQGYIEESNVVVVEEMVKMIETLRTYESYQKIIQTFDETSYKSVNEVGRVQ